MTPSKVFLIAFWAAFGIFIGTWVIRVFWRIRSEVKRRAAGDAPLQSTRSVVWRDPGAADKRDLAAGPGGRDGAPAPPFHFVEEHATGSQPNVSVRDSRERVWRVKWGAEVHTEAFATRFAWAAGYFVETAYFVPDGIIEGAAELQRARACIDPEGHFRDGRFELDEHGVVKHFDEHGWAWNDNPFVGTRQLDGLKIVVMLLSNWDSKDRRDVSRGSNTAIFEYRASRLSTEARYLITDWGGAMGRWGTTVVSRGRWDAEGFEAQTPGFIAGVHDGVVDFGYQGQRSEIGRGIPIAHVRWFYRKVRQITEPALRTGLLASGATGEEAARFARSMMVRIEALGRVR